jgi:hypothetical protein
MLTDRESRQSLLRLIERTVAESGPENLDVAVWRVTQAIEARAKGDPARSLELKELVVQGIEEEVEAALRDQGFWKDDQGLWHKAYKRKG